MKGYLMIMYYLEQSILLTSSLLVCVLCPPTYLRHTHTHVYMESMALRHGRGRKSIFILFYCPTSLPSAYTLSLTNMAHIIFIAHYSLFWHPEKPVDSDRRGVAHYFFMQTGSRLAVETSLIYISNIYSVIYYLKVVSFFHSVSNAVLSAFFNKKVLESTQMLPKLQE